MLVRHKAQRIAVLVDIQNISFSAVNLYKARVNYKKLLEIVTQERILTRAIAYVINSDENNKEQDFFQALNQAGFETKMKELTVFKNGDRKGDWDVGIAMDAIRLGHKVDSVVIASGDGDFKPVVNYLQQSLGCIVEVAAFGKTTNSDLIEMVDDFIDIDALKNKLLFRTSTSRSKKKTGN